MKKITALLLVLLLALSLGACGGGDNGGGEDPAGGDVASATVYTVDEVQQKLIEVVEIDESELRVEDRDTGTVISYGDWDVWFDTYVLNDPKDAQEMFNIQIWVDSPYDKRIDKNDHKVWVEEKEDSETYTIVAMKGNLVISITSFVDPDTLIDAFDLD